MMSPDPTIAAVARACHCGAASMQPSQRVSPTPSSRPAGVVLHRSLASSSHDSGPLGSCDGALDLPCTTCGAQLQRTASLPDCQSGHDAADCFMHQRHAEPLMNAQFPTDRKVRMPFGQSGKCKDLWRPGHKPVSGACYRNTLTCPSMTAALQRSRAAPHTLRLSRRSSQAACACRDQRIAS